MNNVAITIAFAAGEFEYIFDANTMPKGLVESCVFNSCDFNSLAELNQAVEDKEAELKNKVGKYLHRHYINISPFPRPKGFYPTGGVRWVDKAWAFHGYVNNSPSDHRFKIGDRVRFTNGYGRPLEASIFGFDKDGEAILDWDCYWVSVPLERLDILPLFHSIRASVLPVSFEPWVNKAWAAAGSQSWSHSPFSIGETVRVNHDGIEGLGDILAFTSSGNVITDAFVYYTHMPASSMTAF